jgi:hypothetical protein
MINEKFVPRNWFKYLYYRAAGAWAYILMKIVPPDDVKYKDIPVIINNFNRFDTLRKLIEGLEKRGYFNIHILDNNSSNPLLTDFYKNCKYPVYQLGENYGSGALWRSGIFEKFSRNYFVYTDPDMVMIDECPDDFMLFFLNVMKRHPLAQKVGFSLKIDDLPDHYLYKQHVLDYEGQFYEYFNEKELLYRAPIGCTFALYRPRAGQKHANNYIEIYRTGYPYMAYHLPWYQDSLNPDDDERYYLEHLDKGYWYSSRNKKILDDLKQSNAASENVNSK